VRGAYGDIDCGAQSLKKLRPGVIPSELTSAGRRIFEVADFIGESWRKSGTMSDVQGDADVIVVLRRAFSWRRRRRCSILIEKCCCRNLKRRMLAADSVDGRSAAARKEELLKITLT